MERRIKGTGSIRKRKNGQWEGRYTDSSGKRNSIYGKSKVEVKEKIEELVYVHNTTQFDNIGGDIQFKIWFEHYIAMKAYTVKPQTIYQIKMAYYKHIDPFIGKKKICCINYNDTLQIMNNMKNNGLSASSINNVYSHMSSMFNFALQESLIKRNPMLMIRKERTPLKKRRALTDEELNIILQYTRIRDYQFFLLISTMLYTGMRPGEVCGIKWESFDAEFRFVEITESLSKKNYDKDTKNEFSKRVIPLNNFLSKEFKKKYEAIGKFGHSDDYVFLNRYGKPYYANIAAIRFKVYRTEIEEKYQIDLCGISLHYLRHTFVTKGILSGIDIVTMKDLLGHSNEKMLLNVYAHTNQALKEKSIKAISDSMSFADI